jgi:hypothetical protein
MQTSPAAYTVASYCAAMERNEIRVNREYQRSDKVWPPAARSFLVETILMNFPMPKLFLFQITDLKSRKTYHEIVDGQQRSQTIRDFFDNKLRLSSRVEVDGARGKRYSDLPEELQQIFLSYPVPVDVLVSATTDDIREVFRRINSYTVPLNPEEKRHSEYQGAFKWFVYRLARDFDEAFVTIGAFAQKQLVRMADAKLISEFCHAIIYGVTTTKRDALDSLYSHFDESFPKEKELGGRFTEAMNVVLQLEDLHGSALMRPHMLYSLLLAITHAQRPAAKFKSIYPRQRPSRINIQTAKANLTHLADVLETGVARGGLTKFLAASSEKTNVGNQRKIRVKWLSRALDVKSL